MSNGTNDNTILLDLNKVDFERDISGGEIWQQQAKAEFVHALKNAATQAIKHTSQREDPSNPTIIHDAIFIGGARGTGKTVFLQNSEFFWQQHVSENITAPKLHFCKSIDPTLLVNHDNFSNVVIAHLYNEVESVLDNTHESAETHRFYETLKTVCQSLGKQEHINDDISGLDRVIKYRSGIQLIKYFDAFVKECTAILKVDAIVLPIDDVDMALEHAYEILDVVRRMLGSPTIIPVVTGDLALYQPLIKKHFLNDSKVGITPISEKQANDLAEAYLVKVLPFHNRVNLEPIKRLTPNLIIKKDNDKITYLDYLERIHGYFFGIVNGEENSNYWPYPETARDVAQLIRDLEPNKLLPNENSDKAILWKRLKTWGELKRSGRVYALATSTEQLLAANNSGIPIALRRLLAFNPMEQSKLSLPQLQLNDFFSNLYNSISKESTLLTSNAMKNKAQSKILTSLPAIEKINATSYIRKKTFTEYKDDEYIQLFLNIYTFNNYYSENNQTYNLIFFSRAFELLGSSLLNRSQNDLPTVYRKQYWQKLFDDIFRRAPFHTIYALFPTKTAFTYSDDDEEELDDELISVEFTHTLVDEVMEWEDKYLRAIDYKSEELLALVYSSYNKIFNQMNLLRDNVAIQNDTLADLSLRFKYIVLNAFSSFMKSNKVVHNNVAVTSKVENIRQFSKLKNSDNSIKINLGFYFDFKEITYGDEAFLNISPLITDKDLKQAKLLQAIAMHPIFNLLNGQLFDDNLFPIGQKEKITPSQVSDKIRNQVIGDITRANIQEMGSAEEVNEIGSEINRRSKKLAGMPAMQLFEKGTGSVVFKALRRRFNELDDASS